MKKLLISLISLLLFGIMPMCASAHATLSIKSSSGANPFYYINVPNVIRGLVAWYKFDEGTSTTAIDSTGNKNTGTLTNSPLYIPGRIGSNALTFASTSNQYVAVANSPTLQLTGDLTISFWVNVGNDNNYNVIVSKYDPSFSDAGEYEVALDFRSGSTSLAFRNWNGGPVSTNFTNFFQTNNFNNWTFVTLTINGTTGTAYLNGTAMSTQTIGTRLSSTVALQIGQRPLVTTFGVTGSLDDVRLYNRSLSATEVQDLYYYGGLNMLNI